MAKEVYHKHSSNVQRNKPLSHSEWSSTTAHRIDSQAKGDILYALTNTDGLVGLGIGSSGQFLTVSSSGLPEWSSTITTDRIYEDDIDIELGTGSDAIIRWSTGDADNHSFSIGLGDSNQSIHFTDKAAIATDWNVSAETHPTIYVHSNTTPATDYIRIGAMDGTNAILDIVGGTTWKVQVGGADQFTLTASAADFQDNSITTTGTLASGNLTVTGTGSTSSTMTVGTDLTVTGGDIVYGNGQAATLGITASAHDAAGQALTISGGSTTAGTSNDQAGGALTLQGGQSKGSGAGGNIVFQTANASGSGSSLNALATALTISDDLSSTFTGAVVYGSDGSGVDVTFHSGTSGDSMVWDASEEVLQITGTNGATSLDVLDGDVRVVDKIYFYDRGGEYISSNGSTLAVVGNGTWTGSFDVTGTASTSSTFTVGTDLTITGGDVVFGNGQAATVSITAVAHDAAGQALSIAGGNTTAGTSNNQAGGSVTIKGGQGKGSGAGGDIIFQTANAAGSGSSLNALATALTISDDLSSTFGGAVVFGSDGSGVDVTFHSGTGSDLMLWDASEEQLKITGTDGAVALDVADGNVKIVDSLYFYDVGGEHISSNGSLLTITGITKMASTMYINDSANGDITLGLTINQGSNTDKIMAFKGSGVNHGRTSRAEVDTFASFLQASGNFGGLIIDSIAEDGANDLVTIIRSSGGTASTTKSTSGYGLVDIQVEEHDGSNTTANITSNGNIFTLRAQVGGGMATRILVDEDGDLYSVTSAQTFDSYDDAHLVRALEQTRGDTIRSEWDDFVNYNQDDLIAAKILGAPISDGGLINVTQLQRLHNGAIWQGYVRQKELEQKVATLENKLALIEGAK